LAFTSAIKFET